jgi:hypothetical protein
MPAGSFAVGLTNASGVAAVAARWHAAEGNPVAPVLILAHGAGAPQSHPWMVGAARALCARGLTIVTFDFPYMEAKRKLPDRAPVLEACWLDVIAAVRARAPGGTRLFIGGKSMGGRMATHVAAHHAARAGEIAGLVLLGYPLHPPGKPGERRDAHLPAIRVPALFVQGTRDAFGGPDELVPALAPLGDLSTVHAVEGADHSFAVSRASGRSTREVLERVWDVVAGWVLTPHPR